ncbi:MAG TPA: hypothetical protein VLA44_06465 [Clostridia bacterium]|nr:hypothetical protein [Clostridia bacterium]
MGTDPDEDAVAATVARTRYRLAGPETMPPDPAIAGSLVYGERLIARRSNAFVDRRQHGASVRPAGDLYVTSRRLLVIGRQTLSIDLSDILDAALLDEQVVLLLSGGAALAIEAERPRLLRVQIAAARAARDRPLSAQ